MGRVQVAGAIPVGLPMPLPKNKSAPRQERQCKPFQVTTIKVGVALVNLPDMNGEVM